MTIKRALMMTVLVVAIVALAVPLVGVRARVAKSLVSPAVKSHAAPASAESKASPLTRLPKGQGLLAKDRTIIHEGAFEAREGRLSDEVLAKLGIPRLKKGTDMAALNNRIKDHILGRGRKSASSKTGGGSPMTPYSGQPTILNARSPLSAALMTAIGGRDNQFSEVTLIADWDGREDCAADREAKVDDFSFVEPDIDFSITRTAISEHTIANGFAENIFYYGDSVGNVWVGADTNGDGRVEDVTQINLVAELTSAIFPLDDQIAVTGLAVNPAAEFGGPSGTGEVLWGTFTDSEGFRQGGGTPQRSGLFFILIDDAPDVGFPITVLATGMFAVSTSSSPGGVAVDDNGDLYWHLADLIQFTGGRIVSAFDIDGDRLPDIGFSNYSGVSNTFGNIVAITSGPCNTLYAAVARSFVPGDVSFEQLTEGLFPAPSAFGALGTPSMIISFADCSGTFDGCSGEATGSVNINVGGILPIGDHIADVAQSGLTLTPGVNNFRVFAQGNGPNLAPAAGGTAIVPGTPTGLLKLDMQIDYTAYAGLWVDQVNTVYVISGGTPAGIGKNPSPMLGEVLCFPDACPADRRADFIDLRGDTLPNPPASGGNVGDGDSDRFDHIFYQAPLDQLTLTPAGLAGLAGGFLRYTNRLAPAPIGAGVTLGSTARMLGDDATTEAAVIFEAFDPGHQVAGGDDQNTPFRGDDDNGAGTPPLVGALSGGFEFVFGGPVGTAGCVWNGFFLNSNGNITFGIGNIDETPSVPEFRSGPPRIAPAWTDLNPDAHAGNAATPLQAIGFAGVNAFKIRWINVPQFGNEACGGLDNFGFQLNPISNTFSVTLFDDGTGVDENSNKVLDPADPTGDNVDPAFDLQEGPTDLRFTREPNTGVLVGCSPRPAGSGIIIFDYCRMDLLGTEDQPVIVGYSIGNLDPLNPPGLCEINMSKASAAAETNPFGVLPDTNGQTANICANCCIGEGTEPTLFELFNEGLRANTGSGGEVTFASPDFDLRFEGNDSVLCSSSRQRDLNRGRVCLFGIGCAPPALPECRSVVVGTPFATTPTTTGVINALCAVQLNLVGCGFFPNEVTTICQGFQTETGIPLQRPGKTVTTAATLACDTNGDGIPEATIALTGVTPVNCNLIRATASPLANMPGTAFPDTCCGGAGTITVTTTFSSGDNNAFGPFTRTTVCSLALGTRAPVVYSVTPSDGNCAAGLQDLLISGACFCINGVSNVTSVIFQDQANAANTITVGVNPSAAGQVKTVTCQLLDVLVNFTTANAGKTFLVFVVGPNGTSRNLVAAVTGAPAGCPLGNEQGFKVFFACNSSTTPTPGGTPDIAVVTSCHLDRQVTGQFFLDVTGTGIKEGATATVGGLTPKKIKVVEVSPGTSNPTKLRLVKKVCGGLPGNVLITNPGPNGGTSQPFNCTERCPVE